MTEADFVANLSMLLRDQPRLTTADLTDWAVAYWDGEEVQFVFLNDETGTLDEGFELDHYVWAEWEEEFSFWLRSPRFSQRAELRNWLADSPPLDAGV